MGNVINKAPDRRRTRRRRYIEAVEPFRKQFNCTAAQVHGHIQTVLNENRSLKEKLIGKSNELSALKDFINNVTDFSSQDTIKMLLELAKLP